MVDEIGVAKAMVWWQREQSRVPHSLPYATIDSGKNWPRLTPLV